MKYRPLDANGDYTIGVPYLVDSSATVAQAILTRLRLWQGEWFLDTTEGTPYLQQILGKQLDGAPDVAIRARILATPGVTAIVAYSSTYVGSTRALTVSATVQTIYGNVSITAPIVPIPPGPPKLLTDSGVQITTDDGQTITLSS